MKARPSGLLHSSPKPYPSVGLAVMAAVLTQLAVVPHAAAQTQAAPAVEESPAAQAEKHLRRALAHYEAKTYNQAAAEFSAAYRLDPKRDLLYAWAQAVRLAGDCPGAQALYRRFLAERPPASEAARARANLDRCQTSGETDVGPKVNLAAAASPAPVPAPVPAPPWYTDRPTVALLGLAVVTAGAAGGLAALSARDLGSAKTATTYVDAEALVNRADSRRRLSFWAAGTAGAFAAAALVRYAFRATQSHVTAVVQIDSETVIGLALVGPTW